MGTAKIRQIISDAHAQEQRDPALRQFFEARLADLETRLVLPADNPLGALEEFSRRYIDYVPEFLELARKQAAMLQAGKQVDAFINMAEDFFLAPPEAVQETPGLQALMDEAFLAQRLIEEVNDRFIRSRGKALVNLDMTRANIVAHHLIGEPLASGLESLISQCLNLIASRSGLFEPLSGCPAESGAARLAPPCMSSDVAVDLRLDGYLAG